MVSFLDILRRGRADRDVDDESATSPVPNESSSQNEQDSESSDESSEEEQAEAIAAFRRRARTEKARIAALLARERRRQGAEPHAKTPLHPASSYLPHLQPRPEINKPGNHQKHLRLRRMRVVFSWFKAWCASIAHFLQGIHGGHSLVINVVDDSNCVLSQLVEGAPQWRKSRVVTVMNQVQTVVIQYSSSGEPCHQSYLVHAPLVCVDKANAPTLGAELRSWLLSFLGKVGWRFQEFGIHVDAFAHFPIQGTLLCWDSLKTNLAVLRRLRAMVHMKHVKDGYQTLYPLLGVVCLLHQCSLLRKPVLYHFPGFWSSVVRLAHLWEVGTFKQQFRAALLRTICVNFRVVHCSALPDAAKQWRHKRNQLCGLYSNDPNYSRKRRLLHMQLLLHDNGDPEGTNWVHYCTGRCCLGTTTAEKEHFAMLQVCKYMTLLFGYGFAVPLLYRWVHAAPALMWCKEPRPARSGNVTLHI